MREVTVLEVIATHQRAGQGRVTRIASMLSEPMSRRAIIRFAVAAVVSPSPACCFGR